MKEFVGNVKIIFQEKFEKEYKFTNNGDVILSSIIVNKLGADNQPFDKQIPYTITQVDEEFTLIPSVEHDKFVIVFQKYVEGKQINLSVDDYGSNYGTPVRI